MAPPKAPVAIDPAIRSLIEARIETARGVFERVMKRYEQSQVLIHEDTPVWSRRWMEEEISLSTTSAEKVSAILKHLERTKKLEQIVDQYAKVGQGQVEDTLKCKYFRLEAEQMLAEVRAASPDVPLPRSR